MFISTRTAWIVIGVIFLIDQTSKLGVVFALDLPNAGTIRLLPFLNFTMVWNSGISMGLPLGDWLGKYGIIIMTIAVCCYLLWWLHKSATGYEKSALALILGGALGNLLDRFTFGAVADFIHVYGFGYSFYVFNIADAAITVGAIILIGDALRQVLKRPQKNKIGKVSK